MSKNLSSMAISPLFRAAATLAIFGLVAGPWTAHRASSAPTSFVVVAEYFSYVPGGTNQPVELTITQGSSLTLVNIDPIGGEHSLTADDFSGDDPLFDSDLIDNPGQTPVVGVEKLPPGNYGFHCQIHWYVPMQGMLHVIP